MENKIPSRIKRRRNIKIKKSTIGIFVACFAFIFSMFYVFAGENNKISIEKIESASRGEELDISVNLESVKEYNSAMVEIEFDNTVLEYTGATPATVGNPSASKKNQIAMTCVAPNSDEEIAETNETGIIQIACVIPTEGKTVNEDIELAELYFDVLSDAKGGKSMIEITKSAMGKEIDSEKETLTVDTEDGYVIVTAHVDLETVELTKATYELQKGANDTLTVSYEPADTTDDKTFTYVSSDENVVSVDGTGKMTAKAVGSATITVTAFGKELTADVTVVNHITAVTISGSKHELSKDEELQLSAVITPADTSDDKTITWTSSNTSIATVDNTGKVTAIAGGETIITAISTNNIVDTYAINVVVPMIDFTTTDTTVNLNKGDNKTVNTTITPADTTESKVISWESDNTTVATVDSNGVITAVGGGNATITGTLPNAKMVTITVTVTVPLEKIELDQESIELIPDQKQTINAEITPNDTTEPKTITWISSDETVATVDNGEITAVAAGTATITATVGTKSDTVTVKVLKPIDSISISEPSVTLNRNESKELTAIILPADAEESKDVTWTSSDPTSVLVSANGTITGLKGTQSPVTITATLPNGKHAESLVTVVVKINSIDINKTSTTINKGENETLTITINPEDTSEEKTVSWTSSDETVATVDSNGKVTALKAGNTTITASVGTFTKTCAVQVKVPITSIEIDSEDVVLARGNNKTITATVNPEDTTEDTTITWSSDKESVATIDANGKIIAVGAGSATITATVGSKTDTIKVTVNVPVTEFTVNKETLTLVKYKSETLVTTINPSDTTENTKVTWTSNKENVATVDENGKVTAVGEGTATITGKLENNMTVTTTVTVTIIPVESITVSDETLAMKKNENKTLTVTYAPTDATEIDDVIWNSSDETVATVDDNGKVIALKAGTTTITAKMGSLTDTTEVTVTEIHLEDITLENNAPKAVVGKNYKIEVTFDPIDATDDVTYEYESSDEDIATIDSNGNVTSKKAGNVTITVKATAGGNTYTKTIVLTFTAPASPQTGVTPIWLYGIITVILLALGIVIYKKRAMI